jgi:hypothetical protein
VGLGFVLLMRSINVRSHSCSEMIGNKVFVVSSEAPKPSVCAYAKAVDVCGRCCVIEEFPLCGGGSTYRINEI